MARWFVISGGQRTAFINGWVGMIHLLGYPEQCNTMYYHVMINFEAQIRV